ncbi:class I SAM-dependent methyltransferase [Microbacterium sp. bgisy203]|uniref:class I SAM-dependent methyltransferase n=1 Tax=Microbacterium sp. bgisy203 TaxID=3413799 RepID=UPI003D74B75A
MAYDDPRLVELYDIDNPDGPDHDFYRALAADVDASAIVDLGCGTGMLTTTLARPGRSVVGVDPSAAMLDVARARPGGDQVDWIRGDSRALPARGFDYALMTGNVAQHIGDDAWGRTLRDLRRVMRPGATLAFETRNPDARAWEDWSSPTRSTRHTRHGELIEWMTAEEIAPGTVRIEASNYFVEADETVIDRFDLVFRDLETVSRDLEAAGFDVEAVSGDGLETPFEGSAPLMVFVARAAR